MTLISNNQKLLLVLIKRYTFKKGKVLKNRNKVLLDDVQLSNNNSRFTYTPISVVSHQGEDNNGHYVCYSKREDSWIEFSDTHMREKKAPPEDAFIVLLERQ